MLHQWLELGICHGPDKEWNDDDDADGDEDEVGIWPERSELNEHDQNKICMAELPLSDLCKTKRRIDRRGPKIVDRGYAVGYSQMKGSRCQ